jgi:hypothetical protein
MRWPTLHRSASPLSYGLVDSLGASLFCTRHLHKCPWPLASARPKPRYDAVVGDAKLPIDIDELNAGWAQLDPARTLAVMRETAAAVRSQSTAQDCRRAAAHAIDSIEDLYNSLSAGDPDAVLSDCLRLAANWTRMRTAPIDAERRRLAHSFERERRGLSKGTYAKYGSRDERDAAHDEFARLRDRFLRETPKIKKRQLYEKIAAASTSCRVCWKTVQRGLRKWDRRSTVPKT